MKRIETVPITFNDDHSVSRLFPEHSGNIQKYMQCTFLIVFSVMKWFESILRLCKLQKSNLFRVQKLYSNRFDDDLNEPI